MLAALRGGSARLVATRASQRPAGWFVNGPVLGTARRRTCPNGSPETRFVNAPVCSIPDRPVKEPRKRRRCRAKHGRSSAKLQSAFCDAAGLARDRVRAANRACHAGTLVTACSARSPSRAHHDGSCARRATAARQHRIWSPQGPGWRNPSRCRAARCGQPSLTLDGMLDGRQAGWQRPDRRCPARPLCGSYDNRNAIVQPGSSRLDHRALNRNRNADSNCAGSDLRRKDDRS